jgi:hypothetical protein
MNRFRRASSGGGCFLLKTVEFRYCKVVVIHTARVCRLRRRIRLRLRFLLPIRSRRFLFPPSLSSAENIFRRDHILSLPAFVSVANAAPATMSAGKTPTPTNQPAACELYWCSSTRPPQRPLPIAMVLLESYGSLQLLPADWPSK